MKDKGFTVIAGPCSLESEDQILSIASFFSELDRVDYLRCAMWKPRTLPGGFEGVGEQGFSWISRVRQQHPIKIAVEVATPRHVSLCLEHGIEALWIGARTTCNPFSIQEIAETIKGEDIQVFVKNPLTTDLKLWIGALERLSHAAKNPVMAIHRGFQLFEKDGFRNNPLWEIPIELKRRMPGLKVLCDPSHISGNRQMVAKLAQTACDLDFDGLMIEVHNAPQTALTDSEQQITPMAFRDLMNRLVIRKNYNENSLDTRLQQLRNRIDLLDAELINTLSKRFEIVNAMTDIKKQNNLPVLQMKRWEKLLEQRTSYARTLGINEEFIKQIFEQIHTESIALQEEKFANNAQDPPLL